MKRKTVVEVMKYRGFLIHVYDDAYMVTAPDGTFEFFWGMGAARKWARRYKP